MILRDRDANVNWADEADGTLEERIYYCHNWRGDVSVLIEDDGDMIEWVKYSSYGVPFGLPLGDVDSDGDLDSTDTTAIAGWGQAPYDVRADLDLDGYVGIADGVRANNASPITLGWGNLSADPDSGAGNRKGYAGYEFDSALSGIASVYHVRNRVLLAGLGRWSRRDLLGYVDGANLYEYGGSAPVVIVDPTGEWALLVVAIVSLAGASLACLWNREACRDDVFTAYRDCKAMCDITFPDDPLYAEQCDWCCVDRRDEDLDNCNPCGLNGPDGDYCMCWGCGDDPPVWWGDPPDPRIWDVTLPGDDN